MTLTISLITESIKPLGTFFKWLLIVISVYLGSTLVHHLLNRYITKYRIDNMILYFLTSKKPMAITSISFNSKKRPDINKIKRNVEKEFKSFDRNKIISGRYQFKIKGHPTPFELTIVEGDSQNPFRIKIETMSDEKISMNGTFNQTINFMEKISQLLNEYKLVKIRVSIKMATYLGRNDNTSCSYNGQTISTNKIIIGERNFTDIKPLVKKCIQIWRNTFI